MAHVRTKKLKDPSRISGAGRGLNAHRLVAETAVGLANALYEAHMSADNAMYRRLRENLTDKQARTFFVSKVAPTLLEDARLAMTDCLSQADDVCTPYMKEQIADALILDTDLRANRFVAEQHSTVPTLVH